MAYFGLDQLLLGYNLDALQSQSDSLDKAIAAKNQELVDRGIWTQDQYNAALADMAAGNVSTGANDVKASVAGEFTAGLEQGVQNLKTGTDKTVLAVLKEILGAIPISVWIIGGIALFVWVGGLTWLKGMFAKHAS